MYVLKSASIAWADFSKLCVMNISCKASTCGFKIWYASSMRWSFKNVWRVLSYSKCSRMLSSVLPTGFNSKRNVFDKENILVKSENVSLDDIGSKSRLLIQCNKKGRRLSPNRYAYQSVKRYWNRRPFLRLKQAIKKHIYWATGIFLHKCIFLCKQKPASHLSQNQERQPAGERKEKQILWNDTERSTAHVSARIPFVKTHGQTEVIRNDEGNVPHIFIHRNCFKGNQVKTQAFGDLGRL